PICRAPFPIRPSAWVARRCESRHVNPLPSQVIFDREGDRTLEARGREDVPRMAGICQPLHDRSQALRHPGGGIADAVVVGEQKPHTRAYKPRNGASTRWIPNHVKRSVYKMSMNEIGQTELQDKTRKLLD